MLLKVSFYVVFLILINYTCFNFSIDTFFMNIIGGMIVLQINTHNRIPPYIYVTFSHLR